jgi:hypothetical protein
MMPAPRSGALAEGHTSSLIIDRDAEQMLVQEGWARLPLLASHEVRTLSAGYESLHPAVGQGFDTDFAYLAPQHKREVDELIRSVIEPRVREVFEPVDLFNVTFVVKWPGGGSELPLHQDWSYTDEREHRSVTIWIPLTDVSPDRANGPICLLPRSHLLPALPRGANTIPWYEPHRSAIARHLRPVAAEAGDAVVFDHRLLHASPPNDSSSIRCAITAMAVRSATPLRYYHQVGGRIRAYAIDASFFIDHSPLDLRSHDFGTLDPVADFAAPDPAVPAVAARESLGIETDCHPAPARESFPLRGEPLGGPEPVGGRNGRDRLRTFDLGRSSAPIRRPPRMLARRSRVAAQGVLDEISTEHALEVRSGRATARRIASGPWSRRLGTASWLVELEPGTELAPKRSGGAASGSAVIVALDSPSPPGTLVLQVGPCLEPLEREELVGFDPTWEHTIWNFSPRPLRVVLSVSGHYHPFADAR